MENKQTIQEIAQKLFSLLGVEPKFELNVTEDTAELYLETEENGMLIGYHGETLEALQLILALMVAKATGKFIRISLEVGEYKKNRMDYLQSLVTQTKERVLAEGQGVSLPDLKSWERRFVHTLVAEDSEIMSESSGEGRDRTLTIYPKR